MMVRQGVTFLAVGALLVVIDWGVFVGLSALGVPSIPANVCGRLAGALLGFFLNGSFTFRGDQGARLGRHRFARFVTAWVVLTAFSTVLVAGTAQWLGLHWAWAAKPVVEALMAIISFLVSRQWVFQ
jgi:putative flippase GtrA